MAEKSETSRKMKKHGSQEYKCVCYQEKKNTTKHPIKKAQNLNPPSSQNISPTLANA